MNLADMLSYSDIAELSKIARTYSCECNSNSKNELIQSILSSATRKEVLEKQVGELTMEEIRFVNSLLFDRRESFSLEDLLARVNQTRFSKEEGEAWNPRDMIVKYKQRGWLFNGHSQQTKYLFHVPNDVKSRIRQILASRFASELQYIDEEPEVYREEQGLLSADLLFFLRFLQQNDLQLSADGFLYKRTLQQLLEGMAVQEEMIGRTAWRFGYGRKFREYPTRFSFMYDYGYYFHLFSEEGEQLALNEAGLERLAGRKEEDIRQLYEFWLKLYKGAIPNIQAIVQWVEMLSSDWITARSLETVLIPLIKPYYYDTPESILNEKILKMMIHLGLLRIGEHREHGQVVMVSKLGSSVIKGTYVQEEERIDLPIDNR